MLIFKQMADDLEQMRGWTEQREGEQEQQSRFFWTRGLMPSGPVAESVEV